MKQDFSKREGNFFPFLMGISNKINQNRIVRINICIIIIYLVYRGRRKTRRGKQNPNRNGNDTREIS